MMTDEFQGWRDLLDGKPVDISESNPLPGYYKLRKGKEGPWLPVAIWTHEGKLVCRVGAERRDPLDVWTYSAKNPVSKEAAKAAFATGEWPGDVAGIGDNSRDLTLAEQIKDYAEQALGWLKSAGGVKDKAGSDKAANYRAELIRLAKEADKQRETEKRPHDEAAKAVQAKWKPVVEEAQGAADALRAELTRWMRNEEAKAQAEAAAKHRAEQERIAAERRRIEDEQAKLMREDPIAALTSPAVELPAMPEPMAPVRVQAGGQRGKKASLRTITKWVVSDYEAALAALKDHPTVREAVEKVAAQQAKAGVAVPGVSAIEEKVAA